MTDEDGRLGPVVRLDEALAETALPVRTPVGLLGVVRLGLGLPVITVKWTQRFNSETRRQS